MQHSRAALLVPAVLLMAVGALLLSCAVVGAQARQESRLFRVLGATSLVLAGVDTAQTASAMARPGYREGNPLLRPVADHPWALGAVRVGAAVGLNAWTAHVHQTKPRAALWARVAIVATWGVVVGLNARTVRR